MPNCWKTRITDSLSSASQLPRPAALCGRFAFRGSRSRAMELPPLRADEWRTSDPPSCFPLRCETGNGSSSAPPGIGIGRSPRGCTSVASRLRRRGDDVRRRKKFAQIRAFGLVRRRNERFAATSQTRLFTPRKASHRHAGTLRIASARASARKRYHKKTALNAAFLNAASSRCGSRHARVGAMRGSSPSWRRDRGRGGGENIFAKLLTHRKSVIRFRPSRRFCGSK
jgi:hypothetical protein